MSDKTNWKYKDIYQFYDRVRAVLNNLSDVSLPNEYIDMPERAPYVEKYVKARIPEWQTLDEAKFEMFESAIVYFTASMFEGLVTSRAIKKKQLPTMSLEYFQSGKVEVDGLSLKELGELLLSRITNNANGSGFIGFVVSG